MVHFLEIIHHQLHTRSWNPVDNSHESLESAGRPYTRHNQRINSCFPVDTKERYRHIPHRRTLIDLDTTTSKAWNTDHLHRQGWTDRHRRTRGREKPAEAASANRENMHMHRRGWRRTMRRSSLQMNRESHSGRSHDPASLCASFDTRVVLKVGMVGDSQIGKTSLMVKYVEGSFE